MPEDLFGEQPPAVIEQERVKKLKYTPNGYAAPPGTGPDGKTCKDCAHYTHGGVGRRSYPKCDLMKKHWTRSYGTDIRAGSPACRRFQLPENK